jgi:hypothetical protein
VIHDVLRAVIYIHGPADVHRWAGLCLAHCTRLGYQVVALVQDEDGHRWNDVGVMLNEHRAEVVVTGGLEQLPPDRVPRIEVAEDQPGPPVRRRPTIVR